MEAEVSAMIGAEFGERAPERRTTQRNGYRPREWDTRVGAIELAIPKLRSGPGYFPSFLEPRRRAEQALVAVVQEAYVNGVSTRKVDRVVEQLGVRMTKDQGSRLCRRLDEQVAAYASPILASQKRHGGSCERPRTERSSPGHNTNYLATPRPVLRTVAAEKKKTPVRDNQPSPDDIKRKDMRLNHRRRLRF